MIDSHCHLADETYLDDLAAVVSRARSAGVSSCLCILDATQADEHARAEVVRSLWPEAWFAVGVHPHRAGVVGSDSVPLPERCGVGRVVAIGEIGLDYHYDFAPRSIQQDVFRAQLEHARDENWPVVIHCREAEEDVVAGLSEVGGVRGVFHCFTGDRCFAQRVLDLGFYLSLSGIVTFPKATELKEVARYCPLERLLVETDSPYLAPVPVRGSRNEPANVQHVAAHVAALRGLTVEELREAVRVNFSTLFDRSVGRSSAR